MLTTNASPKCDVPWTLPAKYQIGQFHHLHRFIVVNQQTMVAVEGHYSEDGAKRAVNTLNAHNERNGNTEKYEIYPLPEPLHNWAPDNWHEVLIAY